MLWQIMFDSCDWTKIFRYVHPYLLSQKEKLKHILKKCTKNFDTHKRTEDITDLNNCVERDFYII